MEDVEMAITRRPTAREIGEVFAERARREPIVRALWVTEENHGVHLWLLIDPIEDAEAERELYGLIDVVYERFPYERLPDLDYQMHVMNPLHSTADPRRSLRHDAEQIPLRTDSAWSGRPGSTAKPPSAIGTLRGG
jgi:hypothetical protein